MTQTNDIQGIRLDRNAKILLLTILSQGFVNQEQRSELQKILNVPFVRICYADSAEVVNELLDIKKYNSTALKGDLRADCKSIFEAVEMRENEKDANKPL